MRTGSRAFCASVLRCRESRLYFGINRNGKPVAVMVSAETFDELQAVHRAALQQAIDDGMADIKAGNIVAGDEVFSRLRKQILNAAN